MTIKVTDFNERPELSKNALVVSGRTNIDHPESDTSTVATYTAAGPRAGSASWSLLGDDAGDFSISGGAPPIQGHAELRESSGPGHGQRIQHNGKSQKRGLHRHCRT